MSQLVLHLDGDAFFASCEIAQNPALRGKPVAVGSERGIATAFSYEAKARGVRRGMVMWEIRKICPDIIIAPSNYDLYAMYSQRMVNIVRRHAEVVQEYSIDECFAIIQSVETARNIKKELEESLNMTFSIGVAPTKVLAKVASKLVKPAGFTVIDKATIESFLEKIPVGKVWGIGPSTAIKLTKQGITTTLQFIQKNEAWVTENLSRPYLEIWHELKGNPVFTLTDGHRHDDPENYKSMMKSRMFRPPTADPARIFSELSYNIERLCTKLYRNGLYAKNVHTYIKSQEFRYKSITLELPHATRRPQDMLNELTKRFNELYEPKTLYRATGVTAWNLSTESVWQADLFGNAIKLKRVGQIIEDRKLAGKVFMASSLLARKNSGNEEGKQKFNIIYLGEAS